MSVAVPGAPFLRVRPAKRGESQKWGNPGVYFIALLLVGVSLGPVVYIVLGGFRTNSQITVSPAGLPHPWVFSNYTGILKSGIFWGEFKNSVIVAVVTTVGVVVLGMMASFALARYEFKLKGALYALFASGLMFPLVIAITPLFIIVKDLGLVDNLMGIAIPQIAFGLPTTVIILTPFLRAIPKEIEEAAAIDGSSRIGFFFRMAIPLALPGVITVAILAFITSWNNYILPLYVLNSASNYTLPLGVQQFSSQYSSDTARVLAFTSLSMLPALAFFAIFQRRIVGGLTGAVKG
ncbi:MAG TPA: carbohydrate ABC transporter permease [Streptosporangiaceae bacterium]|nr:carbohydrate ABC transporter permease [Streptosporangiaceae bacterium]